MQFAETKTGRVFVIRLEDGEILHQEIEDFARAHAVRAATLTLVGAAGPGSQLVVGPEETTRSPVVPQTYKLENVYEITGSGTLFPDEETGEPLVHVHVACGREAETITGCIRQGVRVWQTVEVVLVELLDTAGARVLDPRLGFKLLRP